MKKSIFIKKIIKKYKKNYKHKNISMNSNNKILKLKLDKNVTSKYSKQNN